MTTGVSKAGNPLWTDAACRYSQTDSFRSHRYPRLTSNVSKGQGTCRTASQGVFLHTILPLSAFHGNLLERTIRRCACSRPLASQATRGEELPLRAWPSLRSEPSSYSGMLASICLCTLIRVSARRHKVEIAQRRSVGRFIRQLELGPRVTRLVRRRLYIKEGLVPGPQVWGLLCEVTQSSSRRVPCNNHAFLCSRSRRLRRLGVGHDGSHPADHHFHPRARPG